MQQQQPIFRVQSAGEGGDEKEGARVQLEGEVGAAKVGGGGQGDGETRKKGGGENEMAL